MKWTPVKISIATKDGNKTVDARCKGIFAIHDIYDPTTGCENLKTLTHIPTGRSIIQASTTGKLYSTVKKLDLLNWDGVKNGITPKTFDRREFEKIHREASC